MKTIFLKRGTLACVTLASLLTAAPAMAQDTYWLLDGNKHYNTGTQAVTPNSSIVPASNPHVRTVYDVSGDELFSYGEKDALWYGTGYLSNRGGIQAFPIPNNCRQYYLLDIYSTHQYYPTVPPDFGSDMTLMKIDASGSGVPTVSALTFVVANQNAAPGAAYLGSPHHFGAVAAKLRADGSRYLYHMHGTPSNTCNLYRFTIDANGNISSTINGFNYDQVATGLPLCGKKARLKMAPDGKSLAYRDTSGKFVTCDTTGSFTVYSKAALGMAQLTVNGQRRWYISTGTEFGYYVEGNSSSFVQISNIYGTQSDVAIGRDGSVYIAHGNPGVTSGALMYTGPDPDPLYGYVFGLTNGSVSSVNGAGSAYSFGNNVEGEDINAASGIINTPAVAGINGDVSTPVLQVLSCKPIILENVSHTASTAYVLSISEVNGSGTQLIYHSGAVPVHGYFSAADLHSLTTYLAANPGIYEVRIIYINSCGANITIKRRIEVLAAPVPSMGIEGSYQTKTSINSPSVSTVNFGPFTTAPGASVPANPLTVGRTSTIFSVGSASTGGGTATAVCSLEVHIDKAVSGAWVNDVIPYSLYTNQCNPWTAPPSMSIGSFSDANGDPFFVAANAPTGSIWRIRIGMTNQCSTLWRALPFQIGARPTATTFGYLREAGQGAIDEESSVGFSPVPFGNQVTAVLQAAGDARATMRIFSVDGRLIATPLNDVPMQEGSHSVAVETASWPAGVYFYDCTIGNRHYNGKLVKQ